MRVILKDLKAVKLSSTLPALEKSVAEKFALSVLSPASDVESCCSGRILTGMFSSPGSGFLPIVGPDMIGRGPNGLLKMVLLT